MGTDNTWWKKFWKLRRNLVCDILRIWVDLNILWHGLFFSFISQYKSSCNSIFVRFIEHVKMAFWKRQAHEQDSNSCLFMRDDIVMWCLIWLMGNDHLCMTEHEQKWSWLNFITAKNHLFLCAVLSEAYQYLWYSRILFSN